MTTQRASPRWRNRTHAWLRDVRDPHVGRAFIGGSLEGLLAGQAALISLVGVEPRELTSGIADVAQGVAAGIVAHGAVEGASTEAFLAHSHGHGEDHGHGHDTTNVTPTKVPQLAGAASTLGLVGGAALPLGVAAATGSVVLGAVTGGVGLFALGAVATAKFTGRSRWRSGLEHLKLGAVATGFYYVATTTVQALAGGAGLGSMGMVLPAAVGFYATVKGTRWLRRKQQRKRAVRMAVSSPRSCAHAVSRARASHRCGPGRRATMADAVAQSKSRLPPKHRRAS